MAVRLIGGFQTDYARNWARSVLGFADLVDAVVSGTVREDRLRLDGPPISREIGPGTTFTLPPVAIHRVLHAGTGPAVTIHAYSPPLTRTGAYRIGADGELEREAQSGQEELRGEPAAV